MALIGRSDISWLFQHCDPGEHGNKLHRGSAWHGPVRLRTFTIRAGLLLLGKEKPPPGVNRRVLTAPRPDTPRSPTKPFSVADEAALKQRRPTLLGMPKTNISTADLVWVFMEKLKPFGDCSPGISIAIVPSKDGWSTIASRRGNHAHPLCAKRIEQVQGELREIYVLAD